MKQIFSFLGGIALLGLSVFLLLSNINVSSISFYKLGAISTAPILIILLVVLVVFAIVKGNGWCWGLVFVDIVLMIVSVILGTRFTFNRMSALELVLMVGMFAVGLGLTLKNLLTPPSKSDV